MYAQNWHFWATPVRFLYRENGNFYMGCTLWVWPLPSPYERTYFMDAPQMVNMRQLEMYIRKHFVMDVSMDAIRICCPKISKNLIVQGWVLQKKIKNNDFVILKNETFDTFL